MITPHDKELQVSSYLFPGEQGDDGDTANAEDEQLTAADGHTVVTGILGPCMLRGTRQRNTSISRSHDQYII